MASRSGSDDELIRFKVAKIVGARIEKHRERKGGGREEEEKEQVRRSRLMDLTWDENGSGVQVFSQTCAYVLSNP